VRPARRDENTAVLVVPNVKVKMEAQHSIPLLVFMTFYGKFLPEKVFLVVWVVKPITN
jgi:hypothetical protein